MANTKKPEAAAVEETTAAVIDNTEAVAETASATAEDEIVDLLIPYAMGSQDVEEEVFISFNFKNYIIKRGQPVKVPRAVKEIWDNSQKAEYEAHVYAKKHAVREPAQQ